MAEIRIDRVDSLLHISRDGVSSYSHVSDGHITLRGPNGRQTLFDDDMPVTVRYPAEGGKFEVWDSAQRLIISTSLPSTVPVLVQHTPSISAKAAAQDSALKSPKLEDQDADPSALSNRSHNSSRHNCENNLCCLTCTQSDFSAAFSQPSRSSTASPSTPATCNRTTLSTKTSRSSQSPRHHLGGHYVECKQRSFKLALEQKEYIKKALHDFVETYLARRSEVTRKTVSSRDIPIVQRILKKLGQYTYVEDVVEDFEIVKDGWIHLGESGLHIELKENLAAECEEKLLRCPPSAGELSIKRGRQYEGIDDSEDEMPLSSSRKRKRISIKSK